MKASNFDINQFIRITLITSIWIHISEIFRYFVFVIPRTKAFFSNRNGIAEMDWVIFSIWGLWDTILTALVVFMFWLISQVFGLNFRNVTLSATISWLFFFVLFWVGSANMGTADWKILWLTLPLSFLEMWVASFIAFKLYALKPKYTNHAIS